MNSFGHLGLPGARRSLFPNNRMDLSAIWHEHDKTKTKMAITRTKKRNKSKRETERSIELPEILQKSAPVKLEQGGKRRRRRLLTNSRERERRSEEAKMKGGFLVYIERGGAPFGLPQPQRIPNAATRSVAMGGKRLASQATNGWLTRGVRSRGVLIAPPSWRCQLFSPAANLCGDCDVPSLLEARPWGDTWRSTLP
jgi:hypothetical protein